PGQPRRPAHARPGQGHPDLPDQVQGDAMMPDRDLRRHAGKYYGKYQGIVVDNADDQVRGRLKVRVPSVLSDAEVWARPCLPPGHFFVPDVETTIWVEFEAGDIAHPLWVGVWYAGEAVPSEAQVTPPTHRVVHTA